ncbi:excinuclease ABC subunit UvrB [Candidatus Margulisiibacteriota bacterium]
MDKFKLVSSFKPAGDQPNAIDKLSKGLSKGMKEQVLLGVTGSGKTFTMANVIADLNKPTLIISHNKTLAAQLCQEFRTFFPNNSVEYFVSYYDYYQPEAYVPHTDTYIAKDLAINEEIDRLRHSATMSLLERRDVIIVASVSCIYGLGEPEDYLKAALLLKLGQKCDRDEVLRRLVAMKYERNDHELARGKFRVRGNAIDIVRAYENNIVHLEIFDDVLEKIYVIDHVSGEVLEKKESVGIYPATHYVTFQDRLGGAIASIEQELAGRLKVLKSQNKLVEAQRLEQRTKYDVEMIREMGYCSGVENYSRHMEGRAPGKPPGTLMDYFPKDFLVFIDESHVTVPQIGAMYEGDRSRKTTLVEYGFRLPSALDNRPLNFKEFNQHLDQVIYVSATPGKYELSRSNQVAEQIIRPTGLVDPEVKVKPSKGQVKDLIKEIKARILKKERVLVTTLTKRMAEDLADFLSEAGLRVKYLHSDIDTLDRIDILRGLRLGEFDVLVGINLLREGLDLPEVSLVAIFDADKEGFLRTETSLVQTIGRAARNAAGKVILYADKTTKSMARALKETNRRRKLQLEYNKDHKIKPRTIVKEVNDIRENMRLAKKEEVKRLKDFIPKDEISSIITGMEEDMRSAAIALEFEKAAEIRDKIKELKKEFKIK